MILLGKDVIIPAHSKMHYDIFWKGRTAMEYNVENSQEARSQDFLLKMAEHISDPITIIDHAGAPHGFRKFLWLGKRGIANANSTEVIVPAKANYLYAEILTYAQVLIAGDPHIGWDVYSLSGELTKHLPPMSLREANCQLNEMVVFD